MWASRGRPVPQHLPGCSFAEQAVRPLGRPSSVPLAVSKPATQARCRKFTCRAAAAAAAVREAQLQVTAQVVEELKQWLTTAHRPGLGQVKLELSAGLYSSEEDFRVTQAVKAGEALLEVPAELGVTAADAHSHIEISGLTEGRSELVCLALWLMVERAKGTSSAWHPFLRSLPQQTETPILWSPSEQKTLLRGSPVAEEASARAAALDAEWKSIESLAAASPGLYPADVFNGTGFRQAMSVAFAHAAFLDSAQCFALLPLATLLNRTGVEDAAQLDFNPESNSAVLVAGRSHGKGETVAAYDGRPNGELLLATGTLANSNPCDCLSMRASLVRSDRLYSAKRSILESLGFSDFQEFPIFEDRMPLQLLAYFRLSRIQDAAQLALVSFERDTIISQNNEYEILQLMMGDCRERLAEYEGSMEDNVKKLQRRDLSTRERLATRLLLSEQRILQRTVEAIRRRLAPIRGVPTKSGRMADPNEDLREIFDTIESIPQAPAKLLGSFMSWARGEQDPSWTKQKNRPPPGRK